MTEWLVKGLIPQGHTVLVLGQPHAGKSWFLDSLALSVAGGTDFLREFPSAKLPVVLIDEDTPTDTLESRLRRLGIRDLVLAKDVSNSVSLLTSGKNCSSINIRSMNGFRLSSPKCIDSLVGSIKGLGKCLVILDSLSKVCLPWNLNWTKEALQIAERWDELKRAGATLVISHHLSTKKPVLKDEDFVSYSMGNTQLIAQSDTALGISQISPKTPTRFKITPISRRVELEVKEPLFVELRESMNSVMLDLMDYIPEGIYNSDARILPIFLNSAEGLLVQDVREKLGEDLALVVIRASLHRLESEGCLVRDSKSHNRYQYRLNPDLISNFAVLTPFQERLLDAVKGERKGDINDLDGR